MSYREDLTLDRVKFDFYQDTNSVDGKSDEAEELNVTCLSHFGIDKENSFFMNFKTGEYGWSIENPEEFYNLLKGIEGSVNEAVDKLNLKKPE